MFKKLKVVKSFIATKHFADKEQLKEHQQKMLKKLFSDLESGFYPKGEKLEDFPIINKKIFMANFDKINTIGVTQEEALEVALKAETSRDFSSTLKGVTIGLSSGTSGSRGLFLVSEDESARWAGYILKRMLPRPLLQKHKIAFFLRANSNLYESMSGALISFTFYDLLTPIEEHIKALNTAQPTLLIAPAKVLKLLAQSETLEISPKKIISVAEVLEDSDREIIEKRFSQMVHQVYQCTEGFLAHTCSHGNLHINEDTVYIEKDFIDEKSGRFVPIVTDYERRSQPVVRYRLDDVLILEKEPCPCGSVFTRIKKIEGRCDDILKMSSTSGEEYLLYPDFMRRAIISSKSHVEEYKVVKKGQELHIYLEPLEAKESVEAELKTLYKVHTIKPLKHLYHPYEADALDIKRRRIQEA